MARNITITFSDGASHRYENIPDSVTPDMIESRVQKDFPGKKITNIDGGKKTTDVKTSNNSVSDSPSSTKISQSEKMNTWGGFSFGGAYYEIAGYKYQDEKNKDIKVYIGKRTSPKSDPPNVPSYAIYAVDIGTGEGVSIKSGFRTGFDDYSSAKQAFDSGVPTTNQRYSLLPGSTQYLRYQEIEKLANKSKRNKDEKKQSGAGNQFIVKLLAGAAWDLRSLGGSRSQALSQLNTIYGENQLNPIIASMAYSVPKGHYTRKEFVDIVYQQMTANLPN